MDSGIAYAVDLRGPVGTRFCSAAINSTGSSAHIEARGSRDTLEADLTLETDNLPPNQFGHYLASRFQLFIPGVGGGAGNLCLGTPFVRFSNSILNTGPRGLANLDLDFAQLPGGTVFAPGETWSFQFWVRDVGPTSNLSDAVAVTFMTGGTPAAQFPVTFETAGEAAGQRQLLVTLSEPAPGPVEIDFTASGSATAQVDYVLDSISPLVIAPGATSRAIFLTVLDDDVPEPAEFIRVELTGITGATLGNGTAFDLTIGDDD